MFSWQTSLMTVTVVEPQCGVAVPLTATKLVPVPPSPQPPLTSLPTAPHSGNTSCAHQLIPVITSLSLMAEI